jgi:hypothetical protein
MLVSALVMTSSMVVGSIGFLHLALVSILPFALGAGVGVFLAGRLFRSPIAQSLMIVFYCVAIFLTMNIVTLWVPIPFK